MPRRTPTRRWARAIASWPAGSRTALRCSSCPARTAARSGSTSGGMQLPNGESLWMMVDITAVKGQRVACAGQLALQETRSPAWATAWHLSAAALPQLLRDGERAGRNAAVCYLDLDGFKAVNDRLGHEAGDTRLRETGRRITNCLGARTTPWRASAATSSSSSSAASSTARRDLDVVLGRILASVAAPIDLGGETVSARASIGVAPHPAAWRRRGQAAGDRGSGDVCRQAQGAQLLRRPFRVTLSRCRIEREPPPSRSRALARAASEAATGWSRVRANCIEAPGY